MAAATRRRKPSRPTTEQRLDALEASVGSLDDEMAMLEGSMQDKAVTIERALQPKHPYPHALGNQAGSKFAVGTVKPEPAGLFDRVGFCEDITRNLDSRISELYSRVVDMERALYGEARG